MSNEEQNKQHVSTQCVCNCGNAINDDEIDYSNRCNEEGKEYGVVTATCDKCYTDYETSQRGEWEDFEEAKSYLQDYINKKK